MNQLGFVPIPGHASGNLPGEAPKVAAQHALADRRGPPLDERPGRGLGRTQGGLGNQRVRHNHPYEAQNHAQRRPYRFHHQQHGVESEFGVRPLSPPLGHRGIF